MMILGTSFSMILLRLLFLLFVKRTEMRCIHDKVIVDAVASINIAYRQHAQDTGNPPKSFAYKRGGRSILDHDFEPLRIHVHHTASKYLDEHTQQVLETAVQRAVDRISGVLSVVPVPSPLLLARSKACSVTFRNGINKGRCARRQKGYRGEFCFKILEIPKEHLEGLFLYTADNPVPVQNVTEAGPGLNNTDVVLYVVAQSTRLCSSQGQPVIAYASHCQLDQTGRPVAGLVNFCPFGLRRSSMTPEFLFKIALHEILHVLGFSTKLFDKFQRCKDGVCETEAAPVRLLNGHLRLVTPAVVNLTSRHFACHTLSDFGGPLQITDPYAQAAGLYSQAASHWDSSVMHTSIMTAMSDNTSYTVLDPITLAVFEDSGWYKVNFREADEFLWGKGAGCLFGVADQCTQNEDQEYFCSHNSSGCQFFLRDKAVCDTTNTGSHCGIYVPVPGGSCTEENTHRKVDKSSPEVFSPASRCFLSSVTSTASKGFRGQCYKRRCSEDGAIFVQLRGTEWIPCHPGQTIQVSGLHGHIQCPQNTEMICKEDNPHYAFTSSPLPPDTTTTAYQMVSKTKSSPPSTRASPANRGQLTLVPYMSSTVVGIMVYCFLAPI